MEQNPINLDQRIKESCIRAMKNGLYSDVFNIWLLPKTLYSENGINNLSKLPTYEERLKEHDAKYSDFIMSISDKEKINRFNEFVKLFNSELEQIRTTKNFKRANEIANSVFEELFT